MIARTVISIHLEEGVTAKLLLTPALYGVAKERGIVLFPQGDAVTQDTQTRVLKQYAKIAYCAAISAWEVDAVDDPDKGEFPWKYEDFAVWAYGNPKEFGATIDAILIALTGKSARDYAREALDDEKKKTSRKEEKRRPFRWITRRSRPSS